ncbi:MAG: very short patch repair endonuclease [Patescibacteria group bacterium]|nr:very short patch repair endonuclease [Patescibacteria group bacterium]
MNTASEQKLSKIMPQIKTQDSKIEKLFRVELWKHGFRYRKNSSKYFGELDIVLKQHKTVIFIDSCPAMVVKNIVKFRPHARITG